MSVFSALNVAVNGLNAQSRAFANVSDNLANTETIGYKRVDTSFQSLVTQSNENVNDPGGVSATPIYQNSIQGNLRQVDSSTSLAIQGNGFFAVRKGVVDATGSTSFSAENFYTRRGDYTLSKDGFLINGAGYFLTGYEVDSVGTVNTADVSPIKISALLDNPVATSNITYAANLPAGAASTYVSSSSTLNLFDQVGSKHAMTFQWSTAGAANSGEWQLDVVVEDGNGTTGDLTLSVPINFDTTGSTAGTVSPYGTGATAGIVAGTGYTVVNPSTTVPVGKATITFTPNFPGAGGQTVTLDLGTYGATGGVTQFADTDLQVTTLQQNGIPRGSFQSLGIDKNGFVSLNYDNGSSKIFYQVPIVQFYAPNNLQRAEGNAFSQTIDSGTPRYSSSGQLGAGNITGNSLESSNVDIASEFSKMITYQRTYSANARVISTGSSMLEEIINVVR
ncbi:MAG: flagellar hook-basal body complex protein [Alphaproteobacteria bacterium]|nr:flagellar hook-basal body complex protein [Alphaproteobacteria bacterium]